MLSHAFLTALTVAALVPMALTEPAISFPSSLPPGSSACAAQFSYLSLCNSLTAGFTALPFVEQAPCLCYGGEGSHVTWKPGVYDNYWAGCNTFLSSASPAFFNSLVSEAGAPPVAAPCKTVGDVIAKLSSFRATASNLSPGSTARNTLASSTTSANGTAQSMSTITTSTGTTQAAATSSTSAETAQGTPTTTTSTGAGWVIQIPLFTSIWTTFSALAVAVLV